MAAVDNPVETCSLVGDLVESPDGDAWWLASKGRRRHHRRALSRGTCRHRVKAGKPGVLGVAGRLDRLFGPSDGFVMFQP